jgi:glutamate racemase
MVGRDVATLPIPNLAGAIERGASAAEVEKIIREAFSDAPPADVAVLACTHYPLVMETFKNTLPGMDFFDPAVAVAQRVYKQFWPQEVGEGSTNFLVSARSDVFYSYASKFFPGAPVDVR